MNIRLAAMTRMRWMTVLLILATAGCAHGDGARSNWTTLIDGERGLENFNRVGKANWRATDGTVQADSGTGFLVTRDSYRDFEIHAEFWASHDSNSGIFIRMQDPTTITPKNAYEVNIFDTRKEPEYGTGAIVNFSKVSPMPKAAGRWNTYHITAKGPHIVVTLNGQKTADLRDSSFASGPVSLQAAGGTIRWRKFQIRPL